VAVLKGARGATPPVKSLGPLCPPAKFVMQAVLTQLGANSLMLDLRLSGNFHRLMLLMSVLSTEELMCTYVMFLGIFVCRLS